jgi:hypothetical protein
VVTAPVIIHRGGSLFFQPTAMTEFDRAIRAASSEAEIVALMEGLFSAFETERAEAGKWLRCTDKALAQAA